LWTSEKKSKSGKFERGVEGEKNQNQAGDDGQGSFLGEEFQANDFEAKVAKGKRGGSQTTKEGRRGTGKKAEKLRASCVRSGKSSCRPGLKV